MATEFKILRGLSTSLFNDDGSPKLSQDKLVNGYWYLTNDTGEVFVCLPKFEEPETLWLYKINDVDTSSFVTDDQLAAAISAIEIPDVSNFATKDELEDAINSIVVPSLNGYATEEFVTQKIAEAQLNDTDVDLSAYYTKTETEAKIQEAVDSITIPDTSNFATKDEIPDIEGLASEEFVREQIAEIPEVDLSDYALKTDIPTDYITSEELESKGYVTEEAVDEAIATIQIPEVPSKVSELENDLGFITIDDVPVTSLDGYAKESYVDEKINEIEIPDLTDYALKSDIPSVEGLATETFVTNKIAEAQLSGGDNDVDLSGYVTKEEMDAKTTLRYLEF